MAKTGVLLLNLGGPATQADVEPFLFNLFADPEIIRLPFAWMQKPLAAFIARMRAEKSRRNYAEIGGGSPLLEITQQQATALNTWLREQGFECSMYIAMRYWHPFTEAIVEQIKADGIERLIVLPLYPQYSITTTGSSCKLLDELWAADPALQRIERITIATWYDQPTYVEAMATAIRREVDALAGDVHVLFSAHGVPESYVTVAGDPYQQEVEACVRLIWSAVDRPNGHSLSYQSRVGPVKWLQPYTEDSLHALGAAGVKNLVVVPISFISDHIETLQEIDHEYRDVALEAGITTFRRVPTLNTEPAFIQALGEMVMAQKVSEATPSLVVSAV